MSPHQLAEMLKTEALIPEQIDTIGDYYFDKYFSFDEFDSPERPGTGDLMDDDFLSRIAMARHIADTPFIITSGYRTKERNKMVGGVPNSSHLNGTAVDIACGNSRLRFRILESLLTVGLNRIGIGNTFIHVDADPDKSGDVIWTYPNK